MSNSGLNPDGIAELIDWPLDGWPNNCFAIASRMVENGVIAGKAVYGHYHGFIHDDSPFGGRAFTHHGWIITEDNTIVDPTRWVFEGCDPYIYIGPEDDEDYDAGSNRLRAMFLRPAPPFDENQTQYTLPPHLQTFAKSILGQDTDIICVQQLLWMASLPLQMLENKAEDLFRWIIDDLDRSGYIPLDNRMTIIGN